MKTGWIAAVAIVLVLAATTGGQVAAEEPEDRPPLQDVRPDTSAADSAAAEVPAVGATPATGPCIITMSIRGIDFQESEGSSFKRLPVDDFQGAADLARRWKDVIVRATPNVAHVGLADLISALRRPGVRLELESADEPPSPPTAPAAAVPAEIQRALQSYQRLEREAAALAEQYRRQAPARGAQPRRNEDPGNLQLPLGARNLEHRLRNVVAKAFEARQAMQRTELERFRQRLARIEESIAAREALRDKIIDHRVQQLLNPELDWEMLLRKPAVSEDVRRSAASAPEPTASPSTAVVWIEALLDAPRSSSGGTSQARAVYMMGTVVSPDGLIAVVIAPENDPQKRLKSAKVYLDDRRTVDSRLAAYDARSGLGLLKVDAAGLPFLALARDPIAANRRLRFYRMRVSADGQKDRFSHEVSVERTDYQHNDAAGLFTFASPSGASPITEEDAGAALLSMTGELAGIVGLIPPNPYQDQPVTFAAQPLIWAIPANVIERVLRDYEAER